MKKRDELERGCLSRTADDEPIFVLRAQDRLAPVMLRLWSELAALHGLPEEKVNDILELADEMECWPVQKWPD